MWVLLFLRVGVEKSINLCSGNCQSVQVFNFGFMEALWVIKKHMEEMRSNIKRFNLKSFNVKFSSHGYMCFSNMNLRKTDVSPAHVLFFARPQKK